MDDRHDLGGFLQSRRSRLSPERSGIRGGSRRRVQGLRREEVAQLAGISVEYYVRLEQGRATRPSDEVLEALTRALGLDEVEREHLRDLARLPRRGERKKTPAERARPELVHLLAAMTDVPALILTDRMDVLAWNRPAARLILDFDAAIPRDRNLARFVFLEPAARERYLDWEEVARSAVGGLRLTAGRRPDDATLAALIGELAMNSDTFRTLWAGRDVELRTHGRKRLWHPLVGELTLRYENFEVVGGSGQLLTTLYAEPGSPEQTTLQLLNTLAP
ncbi:helix-turn-helix transcriptional regulator [Streptosporangium sp. NPDC000396]|uniref:helix-turn-helix transcriptional regulator n=1 Tax=Streptosporangium sp. NPDC000396 TaxID=3366185 RepID=UPI0036A95B4A